MIGWGSLFRMCLTYTLVVDPVLLYLSLNNSKTHFHNGDIIIPINIMMIKICDLLIIIVDDTDMFRVFNIIHINNVEVDTSV
jgi:hypothetical protein